MMASIWGFFEHLDQPMFYFALIAGLLIAIIGPLIGSVIVVQRLTFISDTLSHFSLAGAAFGAYLGAVFANSRFLHFIPEVVIIIVSSLIGTFLIQQIRKYFSNYKELAMAIVFALGSALAAYFSAKSRGNTQNIIHDYLFGSIFTLDALDLILMIITGFLVVSFLLLFKNKLITMCFDETYAVVSGINVKLLQVIMSVLIAIFVSVFMKAIGVLLISAIIVIPVAGAMIIGNNFKQTVRLSLIISVISMILGFWLSYPLNVTAGPIIVFFNLIFLGIIMIAKRIHNWRKQYRSRFWM